MEIRELYDKDRNKLNKTIYKGEMPLDGEYYLVVLIFIKNIKDNTFLIQRRSLDKGGKWACTAGHPKAGEDSFSGMLTEVKEELGIDLSNEKVMLYDTLVEEHHIIDYYYTEIDFDKYDIKLQEEEVSEIKFIPLEEFDVILSNEGFHGKHIECYKRFKNMYSSIMNNYLN